MPLFVEQLSGAEVREHRGDRAVTFVRGARSDALHQSAKRVVGMGAVCRSHLSGPMSGLCTIGRDPDWHVVVVSGIFEYGAQKGATGDVLSLQRNV